MSFEKSRTAAAVLSAAFILAPPAGAAASTAARAADGTIAARVVEAYGRLPLAFEANRGQADPRVQFLSRGNGYTLFLASTDAVLTLSGLGATGTATEARGLQTAVLRMKVLGGKETAKAAGSADLPGRSHYFIGNDPSAWRAGVPSYAAVRFEGVYPGVDLVYHGSSQRELEYDFVVGPGADPRPIRLGFEGVDRIRLDRDGNLVLRSAAGDVTWRAPVAYQEDGNRRRPVPAAYEIRGAREVAFRLAAYDRRRPLVIDPVLVYSTYLGGSGYDGGDPAIALDASGSAYVAGGTCSANFPTSNPLQGQLSAANDCDVFVAKFSPAGDSLVYSTYLGGFNPLAGDDARAIAVDAAGSAYVTGRTCAANFPTVNPLQASLTPGTNGGYGCDAFVAKLSPDGSALAYSTFLGGPCLDVGTGIAVDAAGNAYLAGLTGGIYAVNFGSGCPAAGFPAVNAFQGVAGGRSDAFVARLPPSGRPLAYSTYLGGPGDDAALGLALDGSGNAYVVGTTDSAAFPVLGPVQGCGMGGRDAFVSRLSAGGNALGYSTCLGGSCDDQGWDIAVDGAGSAYVSGQTCSRNLPVVNAVQPAYGGLTDAFVSRLSPDGHSLLYSTYLGGNSEDAGFAIAVDASGSAYVGGHTTSSNFPVRDAVQSAKSLGYDAFVTKLSPGCGALVYSTYLGGSDALASTATPHEDAARGIAVGANGHAYVVGNTSATNFPTASALQPVKGGTLDAFVARFDVGPPPPVEPMAYAGADLFVTEATAVTLDGSGSVDPACDPLRYRWEQVAGPAVTLSDPTAARPGFTAPAIPAGGSTLTFRLTVDDGVHTSVPDTVDVAVINVNQAPVADAGADQTVQTGGTVALHGGDSFDPDGDQLLYYWTQTGGAPVLLSDPYGASPTFTAPAAGQTLAFTLTVFDVQPDPDDWLTSTDDVQVFVTSANQAPEAHAGSDQTTDEGATVTLQGTASSDPDGDALTYSWTQISGPAVVLSDPTSATPTFTAPEVGTGGETLVFQLVVSDGSSSTTDSVTITVRDGNQPPSCDLARASVGILWPPAHRLVPIGIVGVADAEDPDIAITVTAVTQDEPVNGLGDGDTSPDAVPQGSSVLLRAERSGGGTGRVYTVAFIATDASGATCTGSVTVCVPHDPRTDACADEGQAHDSRRP